MATAKIIGGNGSSCSSSWINLKGRKKRTMRDRVKVCCVASSPSLVMDPYRTLRIQPDASESEVKKAFRKLALQYHPDVCRGSNCGVQFHQINEAYDVAMSNLRDDLDESRMAYEPCDQGIDEPMRGMDDPDWDMWEEWMGWEGAGIRDYSSHINPYL
ncbi:putative Chaperone protein dnaJ 8 chloroplast precursor [Tripterygium wilfordii]|uniref:Putative Chaperone protein dnaJ 8 chloroplast n=1 Tax=Tripterygium wilfordii TaxID=458696 RepID=A0A7J7D616_TRIWF|nr:chaperone protein dnaJ 8, chloroplastic-like [Tripterygium wilfordii]KAF5741795.1 putative Chaperone protein dnaJ 8 chloroplast precursor [Tripterygium wilfordii]